MAETNDARRRAEPWWAPELGRDDVVLTSAGRGITPQDSRPDPAAEAAAYARTLEVARARLTAFLSALPDDLTDR
jgi:hypothetical protein